MKEKILQRPFYTVDPETGEFVFAQAIYEYFAQEDIDGRLYDWAEWSSRPIEGDVLNDLRHRAQQGFERTKNEGS